MCGEKNFIIKIKSGEIVNMNEYAKNVIEGDISEYILNKVKEGRNFDLFLKNRVYRCGIFNDKYTTIFCMDISELKNEEWDMKRKLKKKEDGYGSVLSLTDLVIHDMKNYTFLISGYLEIIEKEGFKSEYSDEMKKIIENMKKLIGKIAVMLKSSEHIEKKRININEIIEDSINSLRVKAKNNGIKIIKKCDDIWIHGDPVIGESFINIIDNAIKYSPPNTPVEVKCVKGDNEVTIRISDRGRGIPEEIGDMIFERFKRGNSGMGMGLGLAVTKHIVDLHGGKIWVERNPGGGSVFCISLPTK